MSDLAMEALEREARPGITEHALAAIVEGAYLGLGGQTSIHYMATTPMHDPSVCVPAQQHSNRVLERGDVLITELSAQYHGYPADTPHALNGDGFSVHPPSHRRESPKALSAP